MTGKRWRWVLTVAVAVWARPDSAAPVTVTGAGATFPAPVYQHWAQDYRAAGSAEVRYDPVGSGRGVDLIRQRAVDFGATDAPLAADELQAADLLQFPALIGGVLPVINITGIRPGELKLTGEVLARIYSGRIRRWDDAAIAALNPTLHLPGSNITVVHRSDASGSTLMWTTYLASADEQWRRQVGAALSPAWPTGVGATGNDGVASYVERTRYAIGYVEYFFARAHHLSDVSLRNRAGRIVRARPDNFDAAVAADGEVLLANRQLPPDAAGEESWPITGASFILVPRHPKDPVRARAVLQFFDWGLHHGVQTVEQLEYAPLPPALVEQLPRLWQIRREPDGTLSWP